MIILSVGARVPHPESSAAAAPAVGASRGTAPAPRRWVMREKPYAWHGAIGADAGSPSFAAGKAGGERFTGTLRAAAELFRPDEPALERTGASAGTAEELAKERRGVEGGQGVRQPQPAALLSAGGPVMPQRGCLWLACNHSMHLACNHSAQLACSGSVHLACSQSVQIVCSGSGSRAPVRVRSRRRSRGRSGPAPIRMRALAAAALAARAGQHTAPRGADV